MQTVRNVSAESLPPSNREQADRPALILHIGAGNCAELDSYIALNAKRIVLAEADPGRARGLMRRTAGMDDVEVLPFAVDAESGRARLRIFNVPDWNSLRAPRALNRLFPGLRLLRESEVDAVSILDLIDTLDVAVDANNWLVIDAPGSEMPILSTLRAADRLGCFDNIVLHCGRDALYEGSASAEQILALLREHAYECLSPTPEDDPELVRRTLRVSPFKAERIALQERVAELLLEREEQSGIVNELRSNLFRLKQEYDQAMRSLDENRAHLERVSGELDGQRRRVSELIQTVESMGRDRDLVAENHQARIDEIQRASHERDAELARLGADNARLSRDSDDKDRIVRELQEQLGRAVAGYEERGERLLEQRAILEQIKAAQDEQSRFAVERIDGLQRLLEISTEKSADVLEVVRAYEARFESLEKGVRKDLVRSISNSTRQIESRIGIESYLDRGYAIPAMGGWAASADISLFLMRLIESRRYDLIIEFGSGTSTVLMASLLYGQQQRQPPAASWGRTDVGAASAQQHGSSARTTDLAPKIVTFEHQRKYFDETCESLRQAGVSEFVEMNYAPLRNCSPSNGESFLYYACEERIAELSHLLRGRRARILVFVDGPPGATGKHARYPALPITLQHFSGHEIDVLMDDHDREDEKAIAKRWEVMLSERSLSGEKDVLRFEKGAILLSIG